LLSAFARSGSTMMAKGLLLSAVLKSSPSLKTSLSKPEGLMADPDHDDHDVTDPAVRALIAAINAGDRQAFFAALTADATMSDDGTDRDLAEWADREIFSAHGQLTVVSVHGGGRSLVAAYRNDTWGEMRTRWAFMVTDGKISRFETGQA
jgi:hypothetical protein